MDYSGQLGENDLLECPRLSAYAPLNNSRREIRLFRLGDAVELTTHSLDDIPSYYAISYCWGPATPTRSIIVQGEQVEIRETVGQLFDVLRKKYEPDTRFWIDMLCIDQHNLAERNAQVSMMVDVYSSAKKVIAWLGPSTPESRQAFHIARLRLCYQRRKPTSVSTAYEKDNTSNAINDIDDAEWHNDDRLFLNDSDDNAEITEQEAEDLDWPPREMICTDPTVFINFSKNVAWPAFCDIVRRPYWTRMWVLQELIVAKIAILLCGNDAITFEKFASQSEYWVEQRQYYRLRLPSKGLREEVLNDHEYQAIQRHWNSVGQLLRFRWRGKKDVTLHLLVYASHHQRCSNPRDKVYALRALSKRAATITVDYSRTITEVFLDFIRCGFFLQAGKHAHRELPSLIYSMGLEHEDMSHLLAETIAYLIPILLWVHGTIEKIQMIEDTTPGCTFGYLGVTWKHSNHQVLSKEMLMRDIRRLLNTTRPGDLLCSFAEDFGDDFSDEFSNDFSNFVILRESATKTNYRVIDSLIDRGYIAESDRVDRSLPISSCDISLFSAPEDNPSEAKCMMIDSRSLMELQPEKLNIEQILYDPFSDYESESDSDD